ncbi:hypothetical protein K438DRAFT_1778049 [Mycena galopus ATCC 62051]|nr:hypothetical protein K438DRAFT_1778049 [Mycena galopus ATCC 62051]
MSNLTRVLGGRTVDLAWNPSVQVCRAFAEVSQGVSANLDTAAWQLGKAGQSLGIPGLGCQPVGHLPRLKLRQQTKPGLFPSFKRLSGCQVHPLRALTVHSTSLTPKLPWHHLRKLRKTLLLLRLKLAPGTVDKPAKKKPGPKPRSKPLNLPKKKPAPKPTDGSNSELDISDVEPVMKPKNAYMNLCYSLAVAKYASEKKKSAIEYDLTVLKWFM